MSGYLDYQRKVGKERSTEYINAAGSGMLTAKGASPKQLVYPQDLFSPECLPFILFFAVDPTTPNVLLDKIALYMPRDVQVNYSINYGEATDYMQYLEASTLDALTNPVAVASMIAGGVAGGLGAHSAGGGVTSKVLGGGAAALAAGKYALNNSSAIGQTRNINQKEMLNPHKAALFEGVNFRRHQFQFELIARNAEESETIKDIIRIFKEHAHPETGTSDAQASWFKWPSAWQIGLYSPARKYLYAISTCHITNIHVNYTSGGTRAFFSDTGAPVAVRLNLEFMETEQLTRERIRQGY